MTSFYRKGMSEEETYTVNQFFNDFRKFLEKNTEIKYAIKEKLPLELQSLNSHEVIYVLKVLQEQIQAGDFQTKNKTDVLQSIGKGIWIVEHFSLYLYRWPFTFTRVPEDIRLRGSSLRQFIWRGLQDEDTRSKTCSLIENFIWRSWMHWTATQRINFLRELINRYLSLDSSGSIITSSPRITGNLLMQFIFELIEHPYREQVWLLKEIVSGEPTDEEGPPYIGTLLSRIEEWSNDESMSDVKRELYSKICIDNSNQLDLVGIRNAFGHSDFGIIFEKEKREIIITYDFRRQKPNKSIALTSLIDSISRLGGFIHSFGQELWAFAIVLVANDELKG